VQTGRIFVHYKGSHAQILARLAFWGCYWGLLGTALSHGAKFGGVIPINKNLWSPSFIFVMAGTGMLLFVCLSF
jgi:predicted acyltransferase